MLIALIPAPYLSPCWKWRLEVVRCGADAKCDSCSPSADDSHAAVSLSSRSGNIYIITPWYNAFLSSTLLGRLFVSSPAKG